jgi:hypothetical protein
MNTKINNKNIYSQRKKDLKIMFEDYLEKDKTQLLKQHENDHEQALDLFANLFSILSRNTILPNNILVSDLTPDELQKIILEWHQLLRPVWHKFKLALDDYRQNVLPEKKKYKEMITAADNSLSRFAEYKELIDHGTLEDNKTYPLKIRNAPLTIDLSFDSGKVSIIRGDINVFHSFLDIIKDVPVDFFSICNHCGKVIIITREGKRYCHGCAAKAKQKEMWKQDPVGAKEREKKRYREKRMRGK